MALAFALGVNSTSSGKGLALSRNRTSWINRIVEWRFGFQVMVQDRASHMSLFFVTDSYLLPLRCSRFGEFDESSYANHPSTSGNVRAKALSGIWMLKRLRKAEFVLRHRPRPYNMHSDLYLRTHHSRLVLVLCIVVCFSRV